MTNFFTKYFKKFDFISQEFNFEYDDSKIYRTIQGAAFSLITFFTAFIITITFGQEIYLRKNPNVNSSEELSLDSSIKLQSFPLIFGLSDNSGLAINNLYDYFDILIDRIHITDDYKIERYYNYSLIECSKANFTAYQDLLQKYNNINNQINYCINASDSTLFMNEIGTANSSFIRVIFSFCNINDVNRNCKADKYFFQRLPVVSLSYVNFYIDSLNYQDPIYQYLSLTLFSLTKGIQKINYYYFVNNAYYSDNGWMLEDYKNTYYPGLQRLDKDINYVSGTPLENYCLSFHFRSSNFRNRINRNYMKVQELFAKVGGIANAVLIIIRVITYHYLRFIYLVFIKQHTYDYLKNELKLGYIRNITSKMNSIDNSRVSFNHNDNDALNSIINNIAENNLYNQNVGISIPFENNINIKTINNTEMCNLQDNDDNDKKVISDFNDQPLIVNTIFTNIRKGSDIDNKDNNNDIVQDFNKNNKLKCISRSKSIKNVNNKIGEMNSICDNSKYNLNLNSSYFESKNNSNIAVLNLNKNTINGNKNMFTFNASMIKSSKSDSDIKNIKDDNHRNKDNNIKKCASINLKANKTHTFKNNINSMNSSNLIYSIKADIDPEQNNNNQIQSHINNAVNNDTDVNKIIKLSLNNSLISKLESKNLPNQINSRTYNNKLKIKKNLINTLIDFSIYPNDNDDSHDNISYLKYTLIKICSCLVNKESKQRYEFEFKRVHEILDITRFKHYLIKSYYDRYFDNK